MHDEMPKLVDILDGSEEEEDLFAHSPTLGKERAEDVALDSDVEELRLDGDSSDTSNPRVYDAWCSAWQSAYLA